MKFSAFEGTSHRRAEVRDNVKFANSRNIF